MRAAPALSALASNRDVLRRVFGENFRAHAGGYALAIVSLLFIAAATAYSAWIVRDIIERVFIQKRFDLAIIIAFTIAGAFILRGIATYTQAVTLARIGNAIVAGYQKRIFSRMVHFGMHYFAGAHSGQFAARVQENVAGVRDLMNVTITAVARDIVTLAALVLVMVVQDPVLSLFTFVVGPPVVIGIASVMRRLRRIARESVVSNSRIAGAMQEAVQGIAVIKAFTLEDALTQRVATLAGDAERRANKFARVGERVAPLVEIVAAFVVAGIILVGGWRAAHDSGSVGGLFSFLVALLLAYDPARRLARIQGALERALVNARMIYEIIDHPAAQTDEPGASALTVGGGEVRFDNVSFAYVPGQPVLSGVSFTARAGGKTALVGPSGAGKSTVFALLERFHEPGSGRILVDGTDIATVARASLRGAIAYVAQHPWLFEGTIRDNIRFGRLDASDAEVEEAGRLAFCDEFVRQLPSGYDSDVGENGVTLSGGQRQRISIARALLRNAPILLLDEATSALDNESEARVQQALAVAMAGRTTIVIAHRLTTVADADTILVLEGGHLVEEGAHAALMRKSGGAYRRLQQRAGAGPRKEGRT